MKLENCFDVLIIGSGAAGLGLALSLESQMKIAVVTKGPLSTGASPRAQGGIASVMSEEDSFDSHIEDTLLVGAGLCDPKIVEFTVKNAKPAIEWLIQQGVQFSMNAKGSDFHLSREGGHSQRRIMHVADKTGSAVGKTLIEQIKAKNNIHCFTEHMALELIVERNYCIGALVLNQATQKASHFFASHVVIATGGASYAYLHTSNPDPMSGDGIAMAWRAGCRIANLEFNQFHPTCLFHPNSNLFLITEALRGEGAKLLLPDGKSFMSDYHPLGELAPRDVVTRAIYEQLQKYRLDCVYLDISHKPADMIKEHFPTIYARCLEVGIDITQQAIPVVPAAHYTCGGVITDAYGQTDVENLYAIGEVACTGLHGANRIASNSLLECLVFAMSAGKKIQEKPREKEDFLARVHGYLSKEIPLSSSAPKLSSEKINKLTLRLRQLMWDQVGIVRTTAQLESALQEIETLKNALQLSNTSSALASPGLVELYNLMCVCELMTRCALLRKESRGVHYNLDYLHLNAEAKDSILAPRS